MQHQRDVVRLCHTAVSWRANRAAVQGELASRGALGDAQLDDGDAEFLGHLNGRTGAALFNDERFSMQVGQVELELLATIGRVERR